MTLKTCTKLYYPLFHNSISRFKEWHSIESHSKTFTLLAELNAMRAWACWGTHYSLESKVNETTRKLSVKTERESACEWKQLELRELDLEKPLIAGKRIYFNIRHGLFEIIGYIIVTGTETTKSVTQNNAPNDATSSKEKKTITMW